MSLLKLPTEPCAVSSLVVDAIGRCVCAISCLVSIRLFFFFIFLFDGTRRRTWPAAARVFNRPRATASRGALSAAVSSSAILAHLFLLFLFSFFCLGFGSSVLFHSLFSSSSWPFRPQSFLASGFARPGCSALVSRWSVRDSISFTFVYLVFNLKNGFTLSITGFYWVITGFDYV